MEKFIIVASSLNGVIGDKGRIPWYSKEDFEWFKTATQNCVCVMGRKTYESLPKKMNPLGREFVVITSNTNQERRNEVPVTFISDIDTAFNFNDNKKDIAVLGGGTIYKHFLNKVDKLFISKIHIEIDGDTKFPEYKDKFESLSGTIMPVKEGAIPFVVETWIRK